MPTNFRKTLIQPLYKKGDESDRSNYRGVSLISVDIKLLSKMIFFTPIGVVTKGLREEQCGFRKARGCVNQIFTLRLTIDRCLSHQTRLDIKFIDFEQAFN